MFILSIVNILFIFADENSNKNVKPYDYIETDKEKDSKGCEKESTKHPENLKVCDVEDTKKTNPKVEDLKEYTVEDAKTNSDGKCQPPVVKSATPKEEKTTSCEAELEKIKEEQKKKDQEKKKKEENKKEESKK